MIVNRHIVLKEGDIRNAIPDSKPEKILNFYKAIPKRQINHRRCSKLT